MSELNKLFKRSQEISKHSLQSTSHLDISTSHFDISKRGSLKPVSLMPHSEIHLKHVSPIEGIFQRHDIDKNGHMSFQEFRIVCYDLGFFLTVIYLSLK
jgi:hypothetical protein